MCIRFPGFTILTGHERYARYFVERVAGFVKLEVRSGRGSNPRFDKFRVGPWIGGPTGGSEVTRPHRA